MPSSSPRRLARLAAVFALAAPVVTIGVASGSTGAHPAVAPQAVTETTAADGSGAKHLRAACPEGDVLLGGHAEVVGADGRVVLDASRPAGAGWLAKAHASGGGAWRLVVTADCALPA